MLPTHKEFGHGDIEALAYSLNGVDGQLPTSPGCILQSGIGELASCDPEFLRGLLGINGVALWRYANGTDTSRVMPQDYVSPVKSIGHGITCNADLVTPEEVKKVIYELSQDIGHRLRVHELAARAVQIWVRGDDLYGRQFQCKLPLTTQLPSDIAGTAFRLFCDKHQWSNNVRAVTVRALDLVPQSTAEQTSLFIDYVKQEKKEKLQDAIEDIRSRFGKRALTYALLLGDLKMPVDGRDKVRMPGMMYQ